MAAVISDSSPLVHLAAIQRFELLKRIYLELFIPESVRQEVSISGQGRPGSAELDEAIAAGWIRVMAPTDRNLTRKELSNLDSGEAAALALALDLQAEVVLIDE